MEAPLQSLVLRLEAVTTRLEALVGNVKSDNREEEPEMIETVAIKSDEALINYTEVLTKGSADKGASVAAFDEIYNRRVLTYVELSAKIGGEVDVQAKLVNKAFGSLRELLITAGTTAKPSDANLPQYLKPLANNIAEVSDYREKNRSSKVFNHLSTVSEAVGALGWVSVSPTPGPFAKEMADVGQFYANRVLKEYKDKSEDHVNWVKAFQGIWSDLIAYIKQYHTTGLSWNAKGGAAVAPPPPSGGGPPPPPPVVAPVTSGGDSSGRGSLLDSLNKGSSVTSGLKKVTNDMKTHKNPGLRLASKVPAKPAPAKHVPSTAYVPKPFQAARPVTRPVIPKKAPIKQLREHKKWIVENYENNRNVVIDQTTIKQSVYIYNCKQSTIIIKGKVNGVTLGENFIFMDFFAVKVTGYDIKGGIFEARNKRKLICNSSFDVISDSCKKTAVVVDDLISALEFVNCQSVQSQINGEVNLVSIDKTDGVQVYLSEQSKNAEIVTAKSSEMNILVPDGSGNFNEFALPEQYKSVWDGKGFVTTPTEST